jgi:riboflavin biosynthesis pyrimidine reductase
MRGFVLRQTLGRPAVTLKLGLTLDGRIALADGSSRWITGPDARAHAHLERARHDAILVGGGTLRADAPIYLDDMARAKLPAGEQVATLEGLRIVPEYRMEVKA